MYHAFIHKGKNPLKLQLEVAPQFQDFVIWWWVYTVVSGCSVAISDTSAVLVLWPSLGFFSVGLACTCRCDGVLEKASRHCDKSGRNSLKQRTSVLAPGFRGLSCGPLTWQRRLCGIRKQRGVTCTPHRSYQVTTKSEGWHVPLTGHTRSPLYSDGIIMGSTLDPVRVVII